MGIEIQRPLLNALLNTFQKLKLKCIIEHHAPLIVHGTLQNLLLIKLNIASFINNKSSTNTVQANDKNYKSNASLKYKS